MSIQVSVVVATYKRPQLLLKCLNALVRQDFPPEACEIVIVDDADSEETRLLVENFSKEDDIKITGPASGPDHEAGSRPRILYAAATDTQGPAAARNLGWRMARGEIIAFTDDDCLPEPDWLMQGVAAIHTGMDAAGGQVIVPISNPPTDYEKNISRLAESEFVTANCFVRRCVLGACGGFDERFQMAWREDSDLQFQIMEWSYKLGRAPAARVVHPVRPAAWGVSLKEQRKSMFNALLYKKFPDLYRTRIQARPPLHYYLIMLSAIGSFAALVAGNIGVALGLACCWAGLTLRFAYRRLQQTRHSPGHMLEMLYTSMIIPPLSIFWRLYGAFRYRVIFF
ncbi:MAG: glycosyltransferase family 2 protein [Bacteroidota bacterium]